MGSVDGAGAADGLAVHSGEDFSGRHLGATDPRLFLGACLERALWEIEGDGGSWMGALYQDLASFIGDPAALRPVYEAEPWLELLVQRQLALGVHVLGRVAVQAAATRQGLGRLRALDEL